MHQPVRSANFPKRRSTPGRTSANATSSAARVNSRKSLAPNPIGFSKGRNELNRRRNIQLSHSPRPLVRRTPGPVLGSGFQTHYTRNNAFTRSDSERHDGGHEGQRTGAAGCTAHDQDRAEKARGRHDEG